MEKELAGTNRERERLFLFGNDSAHLTVVKCRDWVLICLPHTASCPPLLTLLVSSMAVTAARYLYQDTSIMAATIWRESVGRKVRR